VVVEAVEVAEEAVVEAVLIVTIDEVVAIVLTRTSETGRRAEEGAARSMAMAVAVEEIGGAVEAEEEAGVATSMAVASSIVEARAEDRHSMNLQPPQQLHSRHHHRLSPRSIARRYVKRVADSKCKCDSRK
jgi:hypothetical protein